MGFNCTQRCHSWDTNMIRAFVTLWTHPTDKCLALLLKIQHLCQAQLEKLGETCKVKTGNARHW